MLLGGLLSLGVAAAPACGPSRGTSQIDTSHQGGGGSGGGMLVPPGQDSGPPPADASGTCGNTIHPIVTNTPNVFFVFDTSGSMATVDSGQSSSRYSLVRNAAVALVHKLGPLINPGAARFPSNGGGMLGCDVGQIVMPVSVGDDDGPTTRRFEQSTLMQPGGGTPLAASLEKFLGPLSFVPGRTIIVLATDGAPNCNEAITCGVDQCQPNIEGQCPASTNCCAVGMGGDPGSCNDTAASIAAVKSFAKGGIPIYVVGIPGSDVYGSVLDQLALAGGGARSTAPHYYKVDDLSHLASTFGAIASLAISCDFTIADAPPDPDRTNVYLDSTVLPYDGADGWTWIGDTEIELHGKACSELKSGAVKQVQIVSGCPTVMPK